MKPVVVLPPGKMSARDRRKLERNDILVVECEDPSLVRFIEPPPANLADYTIQQRAALQLFKVVTGRLQIVGTTIRSEEWHRLYVEILLQGFFPDPVRRVAFVQKPTAKEKKP